MVENVCHIEYMHNIDLSTGAENATFAPPVNYFGFSGPVDIYLKGIHRINNL